MKSTFVQLSPRLALRASTIDRVAITTLRVSGGSQVSAMFGVDVFVGGKAFESSVGAVGLLHEKVPQAVVDEFERILSAVTGAKEDADEANHLRGILEGAGLL